MGAELSLSQVLAKMEAQIARLREREEYHAQQEAFHAEQRAASASELASVMESYEAFRAVAGSAAEIASREGEAPAAPPQEEKPVSQVRSKVVAQVAESMPEGETFGASRIAAEVQRRFGRKLSTPATPRMVSTVLRRLEEQGRLRLVQKGSPHHEALYKKG